MTACAGVSVCAVFVTEAGANLPCVTRESSNTTWDDAGQGTSTHLDLGDVTNIGEFTSNLARVPDQSTDLRRPQNITSTGPVYVLIYIDRAITISHYTSARHLESFI